jgi:hypothetical protein
MADPLKAERGQARGQGADEDARPAVRLVDRGDPEHREVVVLGGEHADPPDCASPASLSLNGRRGGSGRD